MQFSRIIIVVLATVSISFMYEVLIFFFFYSGKKQCINNKNLLNYKKLAIRSFLCFKLYLFLIFTWKIKMMKNIFVKGVAMNQPF